MGMCRRDHIGTRVMDARMNRERCNVDWMLAFNHLADRVHQNQVRDSDTPKMHAKGIDPEVIRPFRIACRNVSCRALVEAEFGKKAEGRGQAFFAMPAFLFDGCEPRNRGNLKNVNGCGSHTIPRPNSLSGL